MKGEYDDFSIGNVSNIDEYNKYFYDPIKMVGWDRCQHYWEFELAFGNAKNLKVFKYKGEPFMVCSLLKSKSDKRCFFGFYITFPEYKGKGLAFKIFMREFEKLRKKGYNLFLTGVLNMTPNYIKNLGVLRLGNVNIVQLTIGDFVQEKIDGRINKSKINAEKLIEYDKKISGQDRTNILTCYLKLNSIICATFEENEEIKGFGFLIKYEKNYLLGPLTANSFDIAKMILNAMTFELSKDDILKIYQPVVPENNADVPNWEKLGFKKFSFISILGHAPLSNDFTKTFSVLDLSHSL